jgi:hypothetical protein
MRFDAFHEAVSGLLELSFDVLTSRELLGMLQRLERDTRRLPVPGHALINQLARQASETELGGKLSQALANRLQISCAEAGRRIREADDLGPRHSVTGEPLSPRLAATAEAQRAGKIGDGHVAVIRGFCHRLPDFVDAETSQKAETQLARLGGEHRPDELSKLADKLTDCLNPDGAFTDADRARRRGIIIGKQGFDGMSSITGYLTPEARATIDAVLAKLAAPGMCNPEDDTPCVEGSPSEQAVGNDTRSCAQRNHDALNAAAGSAGVRRFRKAQRLTGIHHRHHHLARTGGRRGQGAHRWRDAAAHERRDSTGPPRTSLPVYFRQRKGDRALSRQETSLARATNCLVRQRSWVLTPGLYRSGLLLRGAPLHPIRNVPDHRRQLFDVRLRRPPPARRRRLDNSQKQRRRHRMDSTPAFRPRTSPYQYVPSPRKAA